MAARSSRAQGQGFAQVLPDRNMALDVYAQQAQIREADRQRRAAEAAKAHQELSGKFDDLYKAEIFEARDTDAFLNQVSNIKDKWTGNWEKLYKGTDPEAMREFNDDILQLKVWAAGSKQTKEDLKTIKEDMRKRPDLYSKEQVDELNNFISRDNAGVFQVPWDKFRPKSDIDLDKVFEEKALKPAMEQAHNMFSKPVYYENGKTYYTGNMEKLPEEEADKYWELLLTEPDVVLAINERFKDSEDPIATAKSFYYPRLLINKRSGSYGQLRTGDGAGGFDPGSVTKVKVPVFKSGDAPLSYGEQEVDQYPINYPATVLGDADLFDARTYQKMPNYGGTVSGQVTSFVSVPTENGNKVYAVIRAKEGDIATPVENVAPQGIKKGYDVENIVNGLLKPKWTNQNTTPASGVKWK